MLSMATPATTDTVRLFWIAVAAAFLTVSEVEDIAPWLIASFVTCCATAEAVFFDVCDVTTFPLSSNNSLAAFAVDWSVATLLASSKTSFEACIVALNRVFFRTSFVNMSSDLDLAIVLVRL